MMTLLLSVVAVLLLLLSHSPVNAKLLGAVILPHGDFAFDPNLVEHHSAEHDAAMELHTASVMAGQWFRNQPQLDIVFLSSPHGLYQLTKDFCLYLSPPTMGGDALIGEDVTQSHRKQHQNISGIVIHNDDQNELGWGEVIPLSFLLNKKNSETNSIMNNHNFNNDGHKNHSYMIWSHPMRRYTESATMVSELLNVGNKLGSWFEQRPEGFGVVISGDLAHTHEASGPYGYSPKSELFDTAIEHWITRGVCDKQASSYLLQDAAEYQPDAMSCGYTGMVMLHGMLCGGTSASRSDHNAGRMDMDGTTTGDSDVNGSGNATDIPSFHAKLWARRNVTYYGMMVATFERETAEA